MSNSVKSAVWGKSTVVDLHYKLLNMRPLVAQFFSFSYSFRQNLAKKSPFILRQRPWVGAAPSRKSSIRNFEILKPRKNVFISVRADRFAYRVEPDWIKTLKLEPTMTCQFEVKFIWAVEDITGIYFGNDIAFAEWFIPHSSLQHMMKRFRTSGGSRGHGEVRILKTNLFFKISCSLR